MTTKDLELNEQYWDSFYKSNHRHTPSQFCVCVLTEIPDSAVVVEFGCGNGRDSHYFASQGHITIAMDLSHEAIRSCEDLALSRNIVHSKFHRGDLTSDESVQQVVGNARQLAKDRPVVFYSRFVMHTLDDEQEKRFLDVVSNLMRPGEELYLEFRSIEDADLEKHYGNHYRRYIDSKKFKSNLADEYGFGISYYIVGKGMAKFREEDPYVSRIIGYKA